MTSVSDAYRALVNRAEDVSALPGFGHGEAVISDCGQYRYVLTRRWGRGPMLPVIMLNPSTADASEDDPTIRRCIGFAKRDGYAGLMVMNLFAYRATSPADMRAAADPMGPGNLTHLLAMLTSGAPEVLGAWGSNDPGKHVLDLAAKFGANLVCLGTTKDGHPRHPLYVRGDQPFVPLIEAIVDGSPKGGDAKQGSTRSATARADRHRTEGLSS